MGDWTSHPRVALRSLRAAVVLGLPDPLSLPLVVDHRAAIKVDKGARIELGGRLYLGVWSMSRRRRLSDRVADSGIGPPPTQRTTLYVGRDGRLITEDWALMGPGTQIVIGPTAELRVGAESYLSGNSQILIRESVTIGSDCAIAWDLTVMDSDSHSLSVGGEPRPQSEPIEIGNHVWIGAGVMILKGANIGDGAVIAAGSLVTGEIPPKCLAAGRPARVIKEDAEWH